nr:FAD-binding protein [Pseudomonas cavernicola]
MSGGGIWIPNNHRIAALGGTDSVEEAIRYIKAVTHGEIDDGRIEAYVEHGREMVEYLERHSRVRFEAQPHYADYYPEVEGGKPVTAPWTRSRSMPPNWVRNFCACARRRPAP